MARHSAPAEPQRPERQRPEFVARCSCGFSEPAASYEDAVAAYRAHEKDHEPGQRVGTIDAPLSRAEAEAVVAEATDALPRVEAKAAALRSRLAEATAVVEAPEPAPVQVDDGLAADAPPEETPLW